MRSVKVQSFFEFADLRTENYRRRPVKCVDPFARTPHTVVSPCRTHVPVFPLAGEAMN